MSSPIEAPHRINFSWLIRLRWGAIVGQLVTALAVDRGLGIPLPLTAVMLLVASEALFNLGCVAWLRAGRPVGQGAVALGVAVDILVLSGLLGLTGGPMNPFSFLYLVNLALAAVVLPPRYTWGLVLLALASSGMVFYGVPSLWPADAHMHHHHHMAHMRLHLQGMWVAFAVAAGFIVYFVGKVRRALAEREADLATQRMQAARNERLASLATLSAGAAHELATPLATIAVVTRELERQAEAQGQGIRQDIKEDLTLIRAQVERCRAILDQMAADAGESTGEAPTLVPVRTLFDDVARECSALGAELHRPGGPEESHSVRIPLRATVRILSALVKNAHQASPPGSPLLLSAQTDGAQVWLKIRDFGAGMPPDVLARAGEPFFTTKAPGEGMGLGLFLARTLAERLGGSLTVESSLGEGTTVTLRLPRALDEDPTR